MAFDAGMMACVLHEIRSESQGARIEKVYQPESDEIILQMRSFSGGKKLLINAGLNNPRICFSDTKRENPMKPPMLCMLLRKYLTNAKLVEITQPDFERIAILKFETRDEMGFECVRYLIAEIMGKYSNLIFADDDMKIISSLRTVDLATSSVRQIIPGIRYELPPKQDKLNPLLIATTNEFESIVNEFLADNMDMPADKYILSHFRGVSASVAREIAFLACGNTCAPLGEVNIHELAVAFINVFSDISKGNFSPCIVYADKKAVEYGFLTYKQYGNSAETERYDSAGKMLDTFFESRDKDIRIRQRAADLLRILTNSEARLNKKIELQKRELHDCEKGEEYKKFGDLITANIGIIRKGAEKATVTDYSDYRDDGTFGTYEIKLDSRLSPAANAQRMYKKYNKCKNATVELNKQIEIGKRELEYIYTVFDSLTHAETVADMNEIREELYRSGYASKMRAVRSYVNVKKQAAPLVAKYKTTSGRTVLCGKNNTQNDYITCKLASKSDYWFHVKNAPGSHAVLVCDGEEPLDADFTEAAEIAAFNSKVSSGTNIAVDYTLIKNVKKPNGAKPGFVIYHTNYTAYVTPDAKKIADMRIK